MKKIMVIFSVMLLMLALSGAVYAGEAPRMAFSARGFIDARTELGHFYSDSSTAGGGGIYDVLRPELRVGGGYYDKTISYYDSRMRVWFGFAMGKEVSGTLGFELDASPWGGPDGTRNSFGFFGTDRAAVEVKNLYIDWAVPVVPVPITVRLGAQPYGVRGYLNGANDAMGINVGIKATDEIMINPFVYKVTEGKLYASDDADIYGLRLEAKLSTFTLGAYGIYWNMSTYPITPTPAAQGVHAAQSAYMGWYGVYADGKAGPVNINFDLVMDNGKVESNTGLKDVDYRGWATRATVDYPWERFNFGTALGYGSGADTRKTDRFGLANGTNSKVSSFVVSPSAETGSFGMSEVFYNSNISDGRTAIAYTNTSNQLGRGTIGGTWFAKVYGSLKLTPALKTTLAALYIGDTTKHGNTIGNARSAPFGAKDLRDDNSNGWELDIVNNLQIYKNLEFKFGGGYLWAGDALAQWNAAKGRNEKPDNPWRISTIFIYSF